MKELIELKEEVESELCDLNMLIAIHDKGTDNYKITESRITDKKQILKLIEIIYHLK